MTAVEPVAAVDYNERTRIRYSAPRRHSTDDGYGEGESNTRPWTLAELEDVLAHACTTPTTPR